MRTKLWKKRFECIAYGIIGPYIGITRLWELPIAVLGSALQIAVDIILIIPMVVWWLIADIFLTDLDRAVALLKCEILLGQAKTVWY